jgi:hypothetical protein
MINDIYEFHYPQSKVRQHKILISHDDYLTVKAMPEETKEQAFDKKKAMKSLTQGQEWFTDKSPLFDAIETGILNCNGIYQCKVTLVENTIENLIEE